MQEDKNCDRERPCDVNYHFSPDLIEANRERNEWLSRLHALAMVFLAVHVGPSIEIESISSIVDP